MVGNNKNRLLVAFISGYFEFLVSNYRLHRPEFQLFNQITNCADNDFLIE